MKTWHHALLALLFFLIYVWLVQQMYLFNFQDACKEAGGVYQASFRMCTGLANQEPDLGTRMPYIRWLAILALPAFLLASLQVSLHALVTYLLNIRRSARRHRRRLYRKPN